MMCILNIQCTNISEAESELWNFDAIQFPNELYLIQTDDKYGEWGGDSFVIRLHRAQQSKNLIITYVEYEGQAGPPFPPDPNSKWQIKDHTGQPILYEKRGVIADNECLYQINPKLSHIFLLKRMISSLEILAVAKATSAFSAST